MEEINNVNDTDEQALKQKYSQLETFYGSDSEDTDQMIKEVQDVEKNIRFMMTEISKARKTVEKYDRKLTRRLQRKQYHRMQEEAKRHLEQGGQPQTVEPVEEQKIIPKELEKIDLKSENEDMSAKKGVKVGGTLHKIKSDVHHLSDLPSDIAEDETTEMIRRKVSTLSKVLGMKKGEEVNLQSSPLSMYNKLESNPVRLKDFELAPKKSTEIMAKNPKDEEKEQKLNFNQTEDQDDNYEQSEDNDLLSADFDGIKQSSNKAFGGKSELSRVDEQAISENAEEIKKIMKPEFSRFMNMAKEIRKPHFFIFS